MNETTTDAAAVFAPLWRRKWLILGVALLVAAGAYVYYKRKPPVYSAATQVYLGNGAEEQAQLSAASTGGKKSNAPNPTTQVALINSGIIRQAVRAQLHGEHKSRAVRAALKGKTKAKAPEKGEFVSISGEARSAKGAALLVNTTAQVYIKRKNAQYRREVEGAIALTRKQLRRIEAAQLEAAITAASTTAKTGKPSTKGASAASTLQAATLNSKINQLEAELGVSQVTQVDPAKAAQSVLVSPHPRGNAEFGFAIGLLLAALAAYLLGRMDRRLRSLPAIEHAFETQVLTALLAVKRPLVYRDGHPAPSRGLREALWRLQTTLQVPGAEHGRAQGPRTILCLSADSGDGKSTLAATLALGWAEAGERVAVVEADFRRPVQSRLLQLSGSHGLADVLTGMVPLEQALQAVSFVPTGAGVGAAPELPEGRTATTVEAVGAVSVLVGGTGVASPTALLGRAAAAELIGTLADDFDRVLVDVPSLLQVSDAMPLLGAVDGILIVARLGHTRITSARRLMELLQRTNSAPVLGVVANAVSPAELKKYGMIPVVAGSGRRRSRHNLSGQ